MAQKPRVYVGMPITAANGDHTLLFQQVAARISPWLEPILPHDSQDTVRWSHAVSGNTPLDEICQSLVERDISQIQQADGALFLMPEPSIGTAMEIVYAHRQGIPVLVLVPLKLLYHPWLRYHATTVLWSPDPLGETLDHAAQILRDWILKSQPSEQLGE